MKVELLDSMGDDLSIVNAARVSFAKESQYEVWDVGGVGHLSAADKGLINYLMRNRHGTPFEMVQFKFRVTCPIRVAREWQRHRIGSFNEVSTRYVEMEPEFFVPEEMRSQVGKPGHYEMRPLEGDPAVHASHVFDEAYEDAYDHYQRLLKVGVAKELAAYVLPLGLMTQMIWSVNLRSLFNFLSLRTAPNALEEIRLLAIQVEGLAENVAPVAFKAWRENGKVAP